MARHQRHAAHREAHHGADEHQSQGVAQRRRRQRYPTETALQPDDVDERHHLREGSLSGRWQAQAAARRPPGYLSSGRAVAARRGLRRVSSRPVFLASMDMRSSAGAVRSWYRMERKAL